MATQNIKKSQKRGRVENLRPWKKGQSGNPGGRPKRDLAAEIAHLIFQNHSKEIMVAMLKRLKKGDARVFSALADRAFGRTLPKNPEDTEPQTVRVEFIDVATMEEP